MLGYTAYLSGATMMPRGMGAFISTILYGALSNRINGKVFVAIGLSVIAISGFSLGMLNLQISNLNIVLPNIFMGFGMGFSMIPLITMSVETLSNSQMTNASGIQNLLKNIGAAIGTSLVATMLTRFSQIHQHYLVDNLSALNINYIDRFNATSIALSKYTSLDMASNLANYSLYASLIKQSTLLAFMDSFRIFAMFSLFVIPFLFLVITKSGRKYKK